MGIVLSLPLRLYTLPSFFQYFSVSPIISASFSFPDGFSPTLRTYKSQAPTELGCSVLNQLTLHIVVARTYCSAALAWW